jgi:hypothetical protein
MYTCIECQCLSLRRNCVPPPPPPQASVASPQDPSGGSNSDEGTETLVLYVFYIPLRYFCTKCTERRFLIHVSEVNQMHNEEEFRICNNALMLNLLNTPLTNCNNVHNGNVTINFCFFCYF